MRIIITGTGKAGSWEIRGRQLGRAIGAAVEPRASAVKIARFDICVCVKKSTREAITARHCVFDAVDCWTQPNAGTGYADVARRKAGFNRVIAATKKMQDDIGADYFLPHHYREGIDENQIRRTVKKICYEGREVYLGEWRGVIDAECKRRGWEFVVNPITIADCDAVIAVRGSRWRDYFTDNWKSGVKFSNAIGSLTPFIALPERGYTEYGLPFAKVNMPSDISDAFDQIDDFDWREKTARTYLTGRKEYSLNHVAKEYRRWLISRC